MLRSTEFLWAIVLVSLCRPHSVHANAAKSANEGYFWHIADLHYDPTYSATVDGVSCGDGGPPSFGDYGDYRCDSPWALINSSLYAMRDIKSDVDFLIWTGDDTPHNSNIDKTAVAEIISNLTNKILECFPNSTMFPVLGNHDWSPKHQLPPRADPFYDVIADLWRPWISDSEAEATFRKSAYYIQTISDQLLVVGLNTNLYYKSNSVTMSMPDPGNQFQWLDDILTKAAADQFKVILIGHVPPGHFEKHYDYYWFRPFFNEVFLELLRKHSAIIGSAHFAHHHSDSFRIVYDNGTAVTSFLLAPSVTPWETTLPGVLGGAGNNPGIRLVKYDRLQGHVLDVHQYYLDLQKANQGGVTAKWTLAYNATNLYGIPDVTTSSLNNVANRLLTDDKLFEDYYQINDLYYDVEGDDWSRDIRVVHYCAITQLDYTGYADCMRENTATTTTTQSTSAAQQRSPPLEVVMIVWLLFYGQIGRGLEHEFH